MGAASTDRLIAKRRAVRHAHDRAKRRERARWSGLWGGRIPPPPSAPGAVFELPAVPPLPWLTRFWLWIKRLWWK
jgi:hypothetical protein